MTKRRPVAASGCPTASEPPWTLSRALSSCSSWATAKTWAACASLISKRPISSRLNPLRCSSRRIAGAGPIPMNSGATPTTALASSRARAGRVQAEARPTRAAAAPSTTAQLLPAVCTPLACTARKADASRLVPLKLEHLVIDRHDLFSPSAVTLRLQCALMALAGVTVHGLAAQAIAARQVVGGGDHVQSRGRVVEGLPEKILELHLATQAKPIPVGVGRNRVA